LFEHTFPEDTWHQELISLDGVLVDLSPSVTLALTSQGTELGFAYAIAVKKRSCHLHCSKMETSKVAAACRLVIAFGAILFT